MSTSLIDENADHWCLTYQRLNQLRCFRNFFFLLFITYRIARTTLMRMHNYLQTIQRWGLPPCEPLLELLKKVESKQLALPKCDQKCDCPIHSAAPRLGEMGRAPLRRHGQRFNDMNEEDMQTLAGLMLLAAAAGRP